MSKCRSMLMVTLIWRTWEALSCHREAIEKTRHTRNRRPQRCQREQFNRSGSDPLVQENIARQQALERSELDHNGSFCAADIGGNRPDVNYFFGGRGSLSYFATPGFDCFHSR